MMHKSSDTATHEDLWNKEKGFQAPFTGKEFPAMAKERGFKPLLLIPLKSTILDARQVDYAFDASAWARQFAAVGFK